MKLTATGLLAAALVWTSFAGPARAQASPEAASQAEQYQNQIAAEGKYAFLIFYRTNDAATQRLAGTLREALRGRAGEATMLYVPVTDPAEQRLVARYGVARAPVPMAFAIAPNGAITGVFSQTVAATTVQNAFVTPTQMFTMKQLQSGKLVMVHVQGVGGGPTPAAIEQFQADPEFGPRIVTTSMQASDPREAKFVSQVKVDPNANGGSTLLIAPPGVLVGKFDAAASKQEIMAALVQAGKCCDDPNCKHRK